MLMFIVALQLGLGLVRVRANFIEFLNKYIRGDCHALPIAQTTIL